MRRILIYTLLLGAALAVPVRGTDVGKLQPVGLVQLKKEGELITIVTDTGDVGTGSTVEAAFENLEETTAGVIFLDTADYLLVNASAIDEVKKLGTYLKPSVRVCIAEGEIDLMLAAEYLTVHPPAVKLKDCESVFNAGVLSQEAGRLIVR